MKDEFTRDLKKAYIRRLKEAINPIVEDNMVMHVVDVSEDFDIEDELYILTTFLREEFTVTITNLGNAKNKKSMLKILSEKNVHKYYGKYFMLDNGDVWFESLAWIPEVKNDVSSIMGLTGQILKELEDDYDEIKGHTKPCEGDWIEKYREYYAKIEKRQVKELKKLLEDYEEKEESELIRIVAKSKRYPTHLLSDIRQKAEERYLELVKIRRMEEVEVLIEDYEDMTEEEIQDLIETLEQRYFDCIDEKLREKLKTCYDAKVQARKIIEIEKLIEGYEEKAEDELLRLIKKLDRYPKKIAAPKKALIEQYYTQKVEDNVKKEINKLIANYQEKSPDELLNILKKLDKYPENLSCEFKQEIMSFYDEKMKKKVTDLTDGYESKSEETLLNILETLKSYPKEYVKDIQQSIKHFYTRKVDARKKDEVNALINDYKEKTEDELLKVKAQLEKYEGKYVSEYLQQIEECLKQKADIRIIGEIEDLVKNYETKTENELFKLQLQLKRYEEKYSSIYLQRIQECHKQKVDARLQSEIEGLTRNYEEKTEKELKDLLEMLLGYPEELVDNPKKEIQACYDEKVFERENTEVTGLVQDYEDKNEEQLEEILKKLKKYPKSVCGESYKKVEELHNLKKNERLRAEVIQLLEGFEQKSEKELKYALETLKKYPKDIEKARREALQRSYDAVVKERLDNEIIGLMDNYMNMSESELQVLLRKLEGFNNDNSGEAIESVKQRYSELLHLKWSEKKTPYVFWGLLMWFLCIVSALYTLVAEGFLGKVICIIVALIAFPKIKSDSKDIDEHIDSRKARVLFATIGVLVIVLCF